MCWLPEEGEGGAEGEEDGVGLDVEQRLLPVVPQL